MPDINCRHCGEPWDIYELHDFPVSFKKAAAIFAKHGCGLFNAEEDPKSATRCTNTVFDSNLAQASGVLQDSSPYPDDWLDSESMLNFLE